MPEALDNALVEAGLEIWHYGFATGDLDKATTELGALFGGRWTEEATLDMDWYVPRTRRLQRIRGRARILLGDHLPLPLEVWQGEPGSPWHMPPGHTRIDHIGAWADDLPAQTAKLAEAGYEMEFTAPPRVEGEVFGFAYMRHPTGILIGVQDAIDKDAMRRLLAGEGPQKMSWTP